MSEGIPACPPVRQFSSVDDAMSFTNGRSSFTICLYVNGDLDHVTPAAHFDYIEGKSWTELYKNTKELVNIHGTDKASKILHEKKF